MAKYSLFFFTVLLSLSLGLFVGQNYFLNTDSANSTISNSNADVSLNFGFKERFNSLMNSFFASEKIKPKVLEERPDTSKIESGATKNYSEDVKNLHKEYGVDLDAEKKEQDKKSDSTSTDTKLNSDVTPSPSQQGWVIQVGAFQAESDALNIEQKVKELGFPFYYYKADVKGQKWYRVNIGPFKTLPEATQFKKTNNIQSKFKDAFVRQL